MSRRNRKKTVHLVTDIRALKKALAEIPSLSKEEAEDLVRKLREQVGQVEVTRG